MEADEIERYTRDVTGRMVAAHWAEAEKLIAAAIADGKCKPSDLMLEVRRDGSPIRVRGITDEERWLEWQSSNHGWNTTV